MVPKISKGFTLIELIVVIVLLGIMSAGAGLLITRPIEAYSDQLRRQQLVDSAEMAVRKIETDIRRALPNSLRIDVSNMPDSWALEMINVLDGARYRDEVQSGAVGYTSAAHILLFNGVDAEFNVLGKFTSMTTATLPNSMRAVIYNTSPSAIYNDAVTTDTSGIISYPQGVELTTVSAAGFDDEHHIRLPSAFQFALRSPTQRMFIVSGPVSYVCDKTTGYLTRYADYGYQNTQLTSSADLAALPGVEEARVATQLAGCGISYQPGASQRSGLVSLDLTLTDNKNESVRLLHQVHVDNVP